MSELEEGYASDFGPDEVAGRSSIPPVTPSQVSTLDPKIFEHLIGVGTDLGSMVLHQRLADDDKVGDNTLWFLTDDERAGIIEPLARIAARHAPVQAGPASDIADAVEAGLAATAYVSRNMVAAHQFRQYRYKQAQDAVVNQQREQNA